MAASIRTVVVLPFVPVTASQSCRAPPGSTGRSRQASSTSPITGMPAAAAAASIGVPGRHPGVVTTRSVPSGSRGSAVVLIVTAVDGGDASAPGREGPRDRRAGDAEPVDAYPAPGERAVEIS